MYQGYLMSYTPLLVSFGRYIKTRWSLYEFFLVYVPGEVKHPYRDRANVLHVVAQLKNGLFGGKKIRIFGINYSIGIP